VGIAATAATGAGCRGGRLDSGGLDGTTICFAMGHDYLV
jgi:hypothetical protein